MLRSKMGCGNLGETISSVIEWGNLAANSNSDSSQESSSAVEEERWTPRKVIVFLPSKAYALPCLTLCKGAHELRILKISVNETRSFYREPLSSHTKDKTQQKFYLLQDFVSAKEGCLIHKKLHTKLQKTFALQFCISLSGLWPASRSHSFYAPGLCLESKTPAQGCAILPAHQVPTPVAVH